MDELHLKLTALQLKHQSINTLYSLNSARIDIVPYQFMPALKIMRSDEPRLLIADGVGVGKTIEAGLIMRELQARNDVNSILIVCPKPLVTEKKWVSEMKRFDENFTQLDGATLRYCISESNLESWPAEHQKTIIPYSLFDRNFVEGDKKRSLPSLDDIGENVRFDMVVVDEAHHIRNSSTFAYKAVKHFCEHSDAVVFLTATPIQMGNEDLYTLLNLLRPDLVIDKESFKYLLAPNPHINKAVSIARSGDKNWQKRVVELLEKARQTDYGQMSLNTSAFNGLFKCLTEKELTRQERINAVGAIEGFHSFANIINRTRRRDIAEFCTRNTKALRVQFTEPQRILYDSILEFEKERLLRTRSSRNLKWMTSTIRRQLSSCVYGLAPFIKDMTRKKMSDIDLCSAFEEEIGFADEDIVYLKDLECNIATQVDNLPNFDPKYEALKKVIDEKLNMANNKLMVFSTFRHTLRYLSTKLTAAGIRVGVVHGDIPDEERMILRNRFEQDKEQSDSIDVLLFSEVGCEGLDYQFCDAMVNYDLPWNPMKIEQRIGRIDRRGQKSKAVVIYNLITDDTVDADIYDRCLTRIGVFEAGIGDCEEILGEITEKLQDIATDFTLTHEQQKERLEQLADNEIRKIENQKKLEDSQHEWFGLKTPAGSAEEQMRKAESYWLSPKSIRNLVEAYLDRSCGKGEYILGEKSLKTLRLSREAREILLKDYNELKLAPSRLNRDWQKWLKESVPNCPITFDTKCACENRQVQFIMPLHPLVKQALRQIDTTQISYSTFRVMSDCIEAGEYPFAIYLWEKQGFTQDIELKAICENQQLENELFDILEQAVDWNYSNDCSNNSIDAAHHKTWQVAVAEHKQRVQETCEIKLQSLKKSHQVRVSVLQRQLNDAENEKIQRMRQSQIEKCNAVFERKIKVIEQAISIADIHANVVVRGIIKIEN